MIGEVRACEPVLTCQFTPSEAAVAVLIAVSDETPEWVLSWWNVGQVSAEAAAGRRQREQRQRGQRREPRRSCAMKERCQAAGSLRVVRTAVHLQTRV